MIRNYTRICPGVILISQNYPFYKFTCTPEAVIQLNATRSELIDFNAVRVISLDFPRFIGHFRAEYFVFQQSAVYITFSE